MRLLLDTHIFLWFEKNDPKLSSAVRDRILQEEFVYVSIASFWEIAIKNSIGKLDLTTSISEMMQDCDDFGFGILPIRASHLERLKNLPWIHRDPFDRLLICQAQSENLMLVTVDGNIVRYDVSTLWSN